MHQSSFHEDSFHYGIPLQEKEEFTRSEDKFRFLLCFEFGQTNKKKGATAYFLRMNDFSHIWCVELFFT